MDSKLKLVGGQVGGQAPPPIPAKTDAKLIRGEAKPPYGSYFSKIDKFSKKLVGGQALLIVISFLGIMLALGLITISNTMHFNKVVDIVNERAIAKESAEAGLAKAVWCLNQTSGENCGGTYGSNYAGETDVFVGNASFTTTIISKDPNTKEIASTGFYPSSTSTRAKITIKQETGISADNVSFYFGLQSGEGGLIMSNITAVHGNVYSNGNIIGANQATIDGDAYVAGATGLLQGMDITGDARAHFIDSSKIIQNAYSKMIRNKSKIYGDAYTDAIDDSTVYGTLYLGQGPADPLPANMPVTDEMIAKWKSDASGGEPINGDYIADGGPERVMGPAKITGNMILSNSATIRMTGTIYVQGNFIISNQAKIYLDPNYGSLGGVIVIDGKISTTNNVGLDGSGTQGSALMIVTINTADDALTVTNSATAGVFYVPYGGAILSNNTSLKELTANKIIMSNTAQIWYEQGLANSNFTSGPGGGWALKKGTWRIIK